MRCPRKIREKNTTSIPTFLSYSQRKTTENTIKPLTMADSYTSAADIAALVANVNTAAKTFEAAAGGDVHLARRTLQLEARKLLYSLEEPNTEVWPRIYQVIIFSLALKIIVVEVDMLTTCRSMSAQLLKLSRGWDYGASSKVETPFHLPE